MHTVHHSLSTKSSILNVVVVTADATLVYSGGAVPVDVLFQPRVAVRSLAQDRGACDCGVYDAVLEQYFGQVLSPEERKLFYPETTKVAAVKKKGREAVKQAGQQQLEQLEQLKRQLEAAEGKSGDGGEGEGGVGSVMSVVSESGAVLDLMEQNAAAHAALRAGVDLRRDLAEAEEKNKHPAKGAGAGAGEGAGAGAGAGAGGAVGGAGAGTLGPLKGLGPLGALKGLGGLTTGALGAGSTASIAPI